MRGGGGGGESCDLFYPKIMCATMSRCTGSVAGCDERKTPTMGSTLGYTGGKSPRRIHAGNYKSTEPVLGCCAGGISTFSSSASAVNYFYPRPVLVFGYYRCLRLCVCVCPSVCLSPVWPRDDSWPVQAGITNFGLKVQNTLATVPVFNFVIFF